MSIIEAMTKDFDRFTVKINDFKTCGSKAKVNVSVVAADSVEKADILSGINEQFNGKLRAVPRSFRVVSSAQANQNNVKLDLEGYLVPNVEIIAASSEEGSKMKCVASNMFLDEKDVIWSKAGDFLYKKSEVETAEELHSFLSECTASSVRLKKEKGFDTLTVASGDFISYLSKGEMCFGFVLASDDANAKLMVLAEGEDEPEVIDAFDVQNTVPIEDDKVKFPEEEEIVTASSAVDINAVVNYYKRWFAYNGSYAQLLIDRLKSYIFA